MDGSIVEDAGPDRAATCRTGRRRVVTRRETW